MTATMVLAAGLGTRLRPLTAECPKPLVPIGDRPALFHVLDRVRGLSSPGSPIVVNAHHFADELAAALTGQEDVHVSREVDLLGTAGGVAHAAPLLGAGDVLVWNADVLAELDVQGLAKAHQVGRARAGGSAAYATLAVSPRDAGAGEGNVGLDAGGRIVRLRRETFASGETRGADFLGIHMLSEPLRSRVPLRGCLVGDLYLPEGHAGTPLFAYETRASFVDVGTLAAYLDANFAWLSARRETAWVRGAVGASVHVGANVLVGEGAVVTGEGELERVVVWPGARAVAPLKNAIVTRARVVPV